MTLDGAVLPDKPAGAGAGKRANPLYSIKIHLSIERALFNPEERSLSRTTADAQPERTQGERTCSAELVHTSCRSESSKISLVVLDKLP